MKSLTCAVCLMDQVDSVNARISEGCNLRALAEEINTPYHVVRYHRDHHMPRGLSKSSSAEQEKILDEMLRTKTRLEQMFIAASEKGHSTIQLKIMAELRAANAQWIQISNNLEQAKQHELETEKLRHNPADSDCQETKLEQDIKILTQYELAVLNRILNKIDLQDTSDTIIPDPPAGDYSFADIIIPYKTIFNMDAMEKAAAVIHKSIGGRLKNKIEDTEEVES
jgi:hypothetical protein